jgi:methylphosphotriester-DNA--protein-cysteine methyltransferase
MQYLEHPVPPDLQRHLQCLWVLQDPAPSRDIQVVYPDGRCELVAELGVPMRFHGVDGDIREEHALVFAAQQRGPIRLQAAGAVHCIGLRLCAAASGLVAGARLAVLRDRAPDLHTLDAAFARDFAAAAQECAASGRAEPLWDLLRLRCAAFPLDPAIERAALLVDAHHGDVRIADLARAVGLGLRSLQQRFLVQVGATCKEYARIRRLHALVRTLDAGPIALADAAALHGYTDQAHATHEVARLTGTTPAALARALSDDRASDAAFRLAAAFVRGRASDRGARAAR